MLVEAAIEESNRGSVVLINSYPGMPDVSYTSILYCYYTISRAKIIYLGRKESEERLLEEMSAYFCNGFTMSRLTMFKSLMRI
jgi:hypothetical protein